MRKCWTVVLLLLLWAGVLQAERVQDLPRPANYVNDFAGVLSPGVQNSLDALCTQVDRQAHAQIAVVTIKTLDGEPIENFATELEDKWKVGPKGSDRGVLLILAVNDRQRRIEVGYGLEGILPDARAGDIGREMVPYLQQGNYDQAVIPRRHPDGPDHRLRRRRESLEFIASRAASAPGAHSHARRLDRAWDLFRGGHPVALPPRWIRSHWFSAGHVYGRRWTWRRLAVVGAVEAGVAATAAVLGASAVEVPVVAERPETGSPARTAGRGFAAIRGAVVAVVAARAEASLVARIVGRERRSHDPGSTCGG